MPVLDINDINSRGQSAQNTDRRNSSSRETHDVGIELRMQNEVVGEEV